MTREITHRKDPETGNYTQIVSPERLREILDADGETHDPPSGFGPSDEWDVGDADPEEYEDPSIARCDYLNDLAKDDALTGHGD